MLYRPNSEHSSAAESFVRDFQRQRDVGIKMELVSVNTRDGAAMASLYDILSFPSVLALSDSGSYLNAWVGPSLPLMDEVAGYMYA